MQCVACLLDNQNKRSVLGAPLAEKINQQQKLHLWSERQQGFVDTIVIHYISAINTMPDDPFNLEAVLDIFCHYGVSSHYLIDRSGVIYQLVPEAAKAWHCGGSIMPPPDDRQGVNEFSIGIELMALPDSGFSDRQYTALAQLCRDIESRWPIHNYIGHEDIAGERAVKLGLRQDIKTDPGSFFDWKRFFNNRNNGSVSMNYI